uniref:Uncharacterized protein n=1 Tax=Anguilla anguilla TaxID=7936 RepID=A0A0E9QCG3_ANGAN
MKRSVPILKKIKSFIIFKALVLTC